MSVHIQLVCIVVSFLYGILLKLLNTINRLLLKKKNIYINIICNFIYTYFIVLLYVIIIYKINRGIFHIYFIVVLIIGYYLMSKYVNFVYNQINKLLLKIKR